MRRPPLQWVLAIVAAGCGGTVASSVDSGPIQDASGDGNPYPGYTPCAGPEGIALCGGACAFDTCPPNKCFSNVGSTPKHDLAACATGPQRDASVVINACMICDDGHLCDYLTDAESKPDPLSKFDRLACDDEGYGIMYHLSGRDDLARYADRAAYDGTRIPPPPATCPSTPGLKLCGGACGDCPAQYTCMGRSPKHPYSLCAYLGPLKNSTGEQCTRGDNKACDNVDIGKNKCFVWQVDPASQAIADQHGICIDAADCASAALIYPGGGFCTP